MKSKPIFFLLLLISCFIKSANAQAFSIAVSSGIMKYQGDIDVPITSFEAMKPCYSAGLQYQLGHFLLRADFLKGAVSGADGKNKSRKSRNLSFSSNISEYSLTAEYDYYNLLEGEKKITPFFFAGIGYFHFNPYTYDSSGTLQYLQPLGTEGQGLSLYPDKKLYNLNQTNIIIGGGLKYNINSNITLSFELTSRILHTDYLDDVSTKYPNKQALLDARGPLAVKLSFRQNEINPGSVFPEGKKRGNPSDYDNYYNSNFKIIYIFHNNKKGFKLGKGWGSTKCPAKVL